MRRLRNVDCRQADEKLTTPQGVLDYRASELPASNGTGRLFVGRSFVAPKMGDPKTDLVLDPDAEPFAAASFSIKGEGRNGAITESPSSAPAGRSLRIVVNGSIPLARRAEHRAF